jgi:hypothetical protein
MPAQEPAVAKLIVALNQLDAIAFGQCEFVGSTSSKVVDDEQD